MAPEIQYKPELQDEFVHMRDDDSAWISVQEPVYVELRDTVMPGPGINAYVESKIKTVAPWLVHSSAYQSAFEEACQLCYSGYDFNLIVYEEPAGRYIACYEPVVSESTAPRRERVYRRRTKMSRFRRYWRHLFRFTRQRAPRPKYEGEILMAPGKRKWVEVNPGRLIVVPEGILRCDQTQYAV